MSAIGMNDPILKRRLDTLEKNLQTALETTKHLEGELKELGIGRERREGLSQAFTNMAEGELKTIKRTLKELEQMDDRSAWKKYGELCDESSQIHREFLEAILGLAIRRKRMDEEICNVADELIRGIHKRADTLTIPASQEAYSRTLARLVRVRFPEWTIWSLPLTAHEIGHVIIEDDEKLAPFGYAEANAEVRSHPEYGEIKRKIEENKEKLEALRASRGAEAKADIESDPHCGEIAREIEKWEKKLDASISRARSRIHQLLADAFGVYTVGPCYAASLIVLRLYPLSTDPDERHAPDAERAALVLEILGKMNNAAPEPHPYTHFINKLSETWTGMMTRSGAPDLVGFRRTALTELAERVWEQFDQRLHHLHYPTSSSKVGGGWNVALGWYSTWAEAINKYKSTHAEDLSESSLRDALNAAWQYRLFVDPLALEPAAAATRALCDEIIKLRKIDDLNQLKSNLGASLIEVGSVR